MCINRSLFTVILTLLISTHMAYGYETWSRESGLELQGLLDEFVPGYLHEKMTNQFTQEHGGLKKWPLLRALQTLKALKYSNKKVRTDKLAIVDYTQNGSTTKRLYMIDLTTGSIEALATNNSNKDNNLKSCAHKFGNGSKDGYHHGGGYLMGPYSSKTYNKQGAVRSNRRTMQMTGVHPENKNATSHDVVTHELKTRKGENIALYNNNYITHRNRGCLVVTRKDFDFFRDSTKMVDGHRGLVYTYPERRDIINSPYWDSGCAEKLANLNRIPNYAYHKEGSRRKTKTQLTMRGAVAPEMLSSSSLKKGIKYRIRLASGTSSSWKHPASRDTKRNTDK